MQFLRAGDPGAERPVVRTEGAAFDLAGIIDDIDGRFLDGDGIERVRELVERGRLSRAGPWVNGEPRQDSHTSDMIFDVAHLVWHLSQFIAPASASS